MKRKKIASIFLSTLVTAVLFSSCTNNPPEEVKPTTTAVDLTDSEVDSINLSLAADSGAVSLIKAPGAGSLEKSFNQMYKSCMAAEDNPPFRKLVYYGTSNSKSIGTVFSKNGKDLINSFYKCFLVSGKIDSAKAYNEISKFAEFNNMSSCDLKEQKNFALSFLLSVAAKNTGDGTLTAELKKSDSIVLRATSWQKIQIYDSLFVRYLDTCTNNSIKQFRNDVINTSHTVLVTVYKISGFTGDIYKFTGFGAGLTGKLTNKDLEIPVESNAADTTGRLKLHLALEAGKNKVIHVSSSGDFYVFGFYKKFVTHE